ncbi:MAG: hypothetical protein HY898_10760 [Deltaproteobacteria bacterium]|nr:hypothetical protein [Deltaproteobacteria bacterium]
MLEHAREVSAKVDGGRTDDPLLRIAELLVDLDGDTVLVVTDSLRCYQHPVDKFLRLLHCDVVNLSGHLLCVATASPRVIVLHHEGWVFDVRVAAE